MKNPVKGQPETSDGTVVLRTWAWGADVRGTLLIDGSRVELRVERHGLVIRRGHFNNVRRAVEAAREWRVEYELQHTHMADASDGSPRAVRCPECGDEVSGDAPGGDDERLHCQTCGHVWTLDRM